MFFFEYMTIVYYYKKKFNNNNNKLKLTEQLIDECNNLTIKKND